MRGSTQHMSGQACHELQGAYGVRFGWLEHGSGASLLGGLHRSDEAPRPDARLCEMPNINGRRCGEGPGLCK